MTIYTDGGCNHNPGGKGGIGIVIIDNDKVSEICEAYEPTTNNRMEILAICKALEMVSCKATIYTDSEYALKCATNEYKRKKNLDLWDYFDKVAKGKKIDYIWVKGHAGNELNERADYLATKAIEELDPLYDKNYERRLP